MPTALLENYWLLLSTALVLGCVVVVGANATTSNRRGMQALVMLSLVLLVVAGRWLTVLIPGPLNPDESLMLAQAIKFKLDWIPWRSVDPGTGGPINSYALLILHGLGVAIDYPLARMTAILCISVHIVLMVLAMARVGGIGSAATACLPAAAFFAFATDADFTHYSSELASLVMISLMAFLISCLPDEPGRDSRKLAFAIGISAFLVCMAKVQGVPLAALLALGLLPLVCSDWRALGVRTLYIAAGGVASVICLLLVLSWAGVLGDFNISFLSLPFQYISTPLDPNGLRKLIEWREDSSSYALAWYWLLGAMLLLFPLHASLFSQPRRALLRLAAAILVAIGVYLALTQPGRVFPHYTVYLGLALPWISFFLLPWVRSGRRSVQLGQADAA